MKSSCSIILCSQLLFAAQSLLSAGEPILRADVDTCAEKARVQVLERVEGEHGRWEVVDLPGMRVLACDGVVQAAVPAAGVDLSPEMLVRSRDYVGLLPFYRPRARRVLLIGLGAGLHVRALRARQIEVHAVDIEPAIVPLAKRYFHFTGAVTIADGRDFIERTERRFDGVILDTFQGGDVPQRLYTREAFQQMAACLRPRGVLAVHVIAPPQHAATKAIARTLAEVFPHWIALRSGFGSQIQHIYLLASREELKLHSEQRRALDVCRFSGDEFFEIDTRQAPCLSDNCTNLSQLCRDLAETHRRRSRKLLRRAP